MSTGPTPPLTDDHVHDAIKRNDLELLSTLYTKAADASELRGNIDEACFFLTQAYVYALQQGADTAKTLHVRLMKYGRES